MKENLSKTNTRPGAAPLAPTGIFSEQRLLEIAMRHGYIPMDLRSVGINVAYNRSADMLREARTTFGMSRLKIGAALCVILDSGQWAGKSHGGFRDYLREAGLEPHAAKQYMRVARRFILDLDLSESQLARIAAASMRSLEVAARYANLENIDRIIDLLGVLDGKDAILEIGRLYGQPATTH